MSADEQTLAVYDGRAGEYAKTFARTDADPDLLRFVAHLEEGDLVLDLGCGPAAASAAMRDLGLSVDPVDASQGMVDFANKAHRIGARLATFDELDAVAAYRGVWANFSLLHSPRKSFATHISAIFRALKPGGIFHLGMKTGAGERRDQMGRFYVHYTPTELTSTLVDAGFDLIDSTKGEGKGFAGDVSPWITILSRKSG